MADFQKAVGLTIVNEDGYVNDPRDPGGETNFGISKRSYPNIDIKTLTLAQAVAIYNRDFWNPLYASIKDQLVANSVFDLGVLFGPHAVVKVLQTILGKLLVDGVFGPLTLASVNAQEPITFLLHFKNAMVAYAVVIVNRNPNDSVFLTGWSNRIKVITQIVPSVPCP
jgi:lysozyme family protein